MNKKQVITKENVEEYYSKVRKIRFKDDLKFSTLKELFSTYINVEDNVTYYKKGSVHCYSGRHRSIDDFINIAKNYFPELKVSQIIKELNDLIPITFYKTSVSYVGYCSTIRKNNLFYTSLTPSWSVDRLMNCLFKDNGFTNCNLKFKDIVE